MRLPAVFLIASLACAASRPDCHQISDTVEKINFEKMAKILKLVYTSGFEFADSPNVPKLVGKAMSRQ